MFFEYISMFYTAMFHADIKFFSQNIRFIQSKHFFIDIKMNSLFFIKYGYSIYKIFHPKYPFHPFKIFIKLKYLRYSVIKLKLFYKTAVYLINEGKRNNHRK